MRDGANFGGIECVLRICLFGNHNNHGRALRLSEQHFRKMAGVDGGVSTSSTPIKRSGIEMPPLCFPRAGITSASSGNRGGQGNFLTCVCLGVVAFLKRDVQTIIPQRTFTKATVRSALCQRTKPLAR